MNNTPPNSRTSIQQVNPSATIIRIAEVAALTGLARGTIYKRMQADKSFPRPVPLSDSKARCAPVGWILGEVQDWVLAQVAKRDQQGAAA